MADTEIRPVADEAESLEPNELLWEVLWKPISLPRNIRESLKLEDESLQLIALGNSGILGGLVANWLSATEVELRHIAVQPECRGRGIGSLLVRELFSMLEGTRCTVVRTISRNTSVEFFSKLGFAPVPNRHMEYPHFSKYGITFQEMRKTGRNP